MKLLSAAIVLLWLASAVVVGTSTPSVHASQSLSMNSSECSLPNKEGITAIAVSDGYGVTEKSAITTTTCR